MEEAAAKLTADYAKPPVVAIRYPKGSDDAAARLEQMLTQSGYNVRYKWLMPQSDCQHEQIIQMSARADEGTTDKMRGAVPEMSVWPVVLQLDSKPIADFVVVISPQSQFAVASRAPSGAGRN